MSQCTLVTPTVPFRVPCPNNTFVRTGLTDGVYSLFIVGTDLDGNTAQSITHSWTVGELLVGLFLSNRT